MPLFVGLLLYTEPGIKGDTANSPKNLPLLGSFLITVPLFIQNDEKIKVDTRTYEYSRKRVK